jgi:hypothetical protein
VFGGAPRAEHPHGPTAPLRCSEPTGLAGNLPELASEEHAGARKGQCCCTQLRSPARGQGGQGGQGGAFACNAEPGEEARAVAPAPAAPLRRPGLLFDIFAHPLFTSTGHKNSSIFDLGNNQRGSKATGVIARG